MSTVKVVKVEDIEASSPEDFPKSSPQEHISQSKSNTSFIVKHSVVIIVRQKNVVFYLNWVFNPNVDV
jgi:hypothetical protein